MKFIKIETKRMDAKYLIKEQVFVRLGDGIMVNRYVVLILQHEKDSRDGWMMVMVSQKYVCT